MPLAQHRGQLQAAATFYQMEAHVDDAPSTDEVWDYWQGQFARNVKEDYDNVILVTGPPGSAKSTYSQRSARDSDPSFGPKRVCWTATELISAARASYEPGQCIVYDEAVTGLLSSDSFAEETKALVRTINIIRAKNLTFYLCIPDVWDIAKAFRVRRADFWLTCRRRPRGYGLMHTRDYSVKYQQSSDLPLWAHKLMNPVRWESLVGTKYWAEYLEEKNRRMDTALADEEGKMDQHAEKTAKNWKNDDDLKQQLMEYWRAGKKMDQACFALHTSPNRVIHIAEMLGIWHRDRPPRKRWDRPPTPSDEK